MVFSRSWFPGWNPYTILSPVPCSVPFVFCCDSWFSSRDVWRAFFEGFVWIAHDKIRVTFCSANHMEDIINLGVTFRGFPVDITPITTKKWVTVLRLAYGIPDDEVAYALSPYGDVSRVKSETHLGVSSGVRSVLMQITAPIPSQLRIRGHLCLIFYRVRHVLVSSAVSKVIKNQIVLLDDRIRKTLGQIQVRTIRKMKIYNQARKTLG